MTTQLSTKFTRLLNVSKPIVSAPMAYATSPALVAAVIKAGGLGFLGAGNDPATKLADAIDEARSALDDPNQKQLVGMGFVGSVLERFDTESDPRLKTVLDKKVLAIWLAFGNDLGKYVARVRNHDETHGHKTLVFVNVNTVSEAERAVNEWKADIIVVQGQEAGGRGSNQSPSTQEFVEQAVKAIPNALLVAAGGISTGSQAASLLTAGAQAIVLGTRLLFTPECVFSDEMKQVLVEAGPGSTARSSAYDIAFPPNFFPKEIEARCVTNGILDDFNAGLDPAIRKANLTAGGKSHLMVFAGTGVSEVNEIQPAKVVIKKIYEEIEAALRARGSKFQT